MTRRQPRAAWLSLMLGLALAACSSAGTAGGGPGGPAAPSARWVRFRHLPGVVDLTGPASDGSFTVAAAGRLFTLSRSSTLRPFAQGPGGYQTAILADRFSRGNKHPGTNSILRLSGRALLGAGVRPGDLLVATEGSARTIDVRCAATCTVRYIAIGLPVSHAEGHIVFSR